MDLHYLGGAQKTQPDMLSSITFHHFTLHPIINTSASDLAGIVPATPFALASIWPFVPANLQTLTAMGLPAYTN